MVEVTAVIRNTMGIHCRPSAVIVKESRAFRGEIDVVAPDGHCDPRSILDLISLGLAEGAPVTIRVCGPGEKKFAPKLAELFERHFDYPPDADSSSPLRNAPPIGAA